MALGVLPVLLILVALCTWISCRLTSRRWDVGYQIFEQGAVYQRYGEYYTINYMLIFT